jgi:hypothetical protein
VGDAEDDFGAADVDRTHFLRLAWIQREDGGCVQDRVAASQGTLHNARVGYVAGLGVDAVDAERAERGRDTFRSSRKDANPMSRSDRVRPDMASPACDQDEHATSVLVGVSRVQSFV